MTTLAERIAAMEASLAELKAEYLKSQVPAKDEWPRVGAVYWRVDDYGRVSHATWGDDGYDTAGAALGNVYRTEQEAKQAVERQKVLTQLRKLAQWSWGDVKCDWTNADQDKCELYFSHKGHSWQAASFDTVQTQGAVNFPSYESALAAVETIGADRMMLLLEVQS